MLMESSNKHKRTSVDFNSVNRIKNETTSEKSKLKLVNKFYLLIKNRFTFKHFYFTPLFTLKRFKKILYKRFFWGRGISYKYSVFISIIVLSTPFILLAINLKPVNASGYSSPARGMDTAMDNGAGEIKIANDQTIQSVHSYLVQPGDSISGIASKFNITTDTLAYTNNLNVDSVLSIGQSLKILPVSGILYKVQKGDTLDSIAKKFNIGQAGYSSQVILDLNLLDSTDLTQGQDLLVPGAIIDKPKSPSSPIIAYENNPPVRAITPLKVAYIATNGNLFISPTGGLGNVTTCFSSVVHPAIDIDSIVGPVPVYASASGIVTWAGYGLSGGSGIAVRIDHGNGYITEYLHFSRLMVSVGDQVKQGQQIGMMGQTGRATGIHVHWILSLNGVAQNPMKYVDLSHYGREAGATSC